MKESKDKIDLKCTLFSINFHVNFFLQAYQLNWSVVLYISWLPLSVHEPTCNHRMCDRCNQPPCDTGPLAPWYMYKQEIVFSPRELYSLVFAITHPNIRNIFHSFHVYWAHHSLSEFTNDSLWLPCVQLLLTFILDFVTVFVTSCIYHLLFVLCLVSTFAHH